MFDHFNFAQPFATFGIQILFSVSLFFSCYVPELLHISHEKFPSLPIPGKISRFPEEICVSFETGFVRVVIPGTMNKAINQKTEIVSWPLQSKIIFSVHQNSGRFDVLHPLYHQVSDCLSLLVKNIEIARGL